MRNWKTPLATLAMLTGIAFVAPPVTIYGQIPVNDLRRNPGHSAKTNADNQPLAVVTRMGAKAPTMPAMIVRPTQLAGHALSDCEVEMVPNQRDGGYTLRMGIPDSITAIELVPRSINSRRNFKIRVDENLPTTAEPVVESLDQQNESLIPHGEGQSGELRMLDPVEPEPTVVRNRVKTNPFFNASAVARSHMSHERPGFEDADVQTASMQVPIQLERDKTLPDLLNVEDVSELPPIRSGKSMVLPVPNLKAKGPATMDREGTADFSLVVTNPTKTQLSNVSVRLSLPLDMDVTIVDRAADFDAQEGTLTWTLPNLAPESNVAIRYRVKVHAEGRHTQRIEIGHQGQFGKMITHSTRAISK